MRIANLLTAIALAALFAWLAPTVVRTDYILGPPEVNKSLKALTLLRKQHDQAKTAAARADALARLAKEANSLASLINAEIYSHGFDQKPLIDLAVQRCEEVGVVIAYDGKKQRYLYDQAAYAEYLRLTPSGAHEQEARFRMYEKTFYAQKSGDRPGIVALIGDIEKFLKRYPKEARRPELELFLVILYRDLSRLKATEPGGGANERKKTQQLGEALIARFPETAEAKVAAGILQSLQ